MVATSFIFLQYLLSPDQMFELYKPSYKLTQSNLIFCISIILVGWISGMSASEHFKTLDIKFKIILIVLSFCLIFQTLDKLRHMIQSWELYGPNTIWPDEWQGVFYWRMINKMINMPRPWTTTSWAVHI